MAKEWLLFILGILLGASLTLTIIAEIELYRVHKRLEALIKKLRGK